MDKISHSCVLNILHMEPASSSKEEAHFVLVTAKTEVPASCANLCRSEPAHRGDHACSLAWML
eukprot:1159223-Pelagomonas_calceolata.AAC.1